MKGGANSMQTLWVLWGAFVSSLAFYGGVAFLVSEQGWALGAPGLLSLLIPLFGAMAALEALFLILFFPRLAGKMDYTAYCILRWAMADSIGIYGLILFLLGASWDVLGAFIGGALFLNVLFRPSSLEKEG